MSSGLRVDPSVSKTSGGSVKRYIKNELKTCSLLKFENLLPPRNFFSYLMRKNVEKPPLRNRKVSSTYSLLNKRRKKCVYGNEFMRGAIKKFAKSFPFIIFLSVFLEDWMILFGILILRKSRIFLKINWSLH